jgi:hypothetical protein
LTKLEEINSLIQLEEANSTQLPKMAEKKKEMTAKYSELMTIWSKKDKAISGSADEDNRLIAEADAVRLDTLNAVRAALNLQRLHHRYLVNENPLPGINRFSNHQSLLASESLMFFPYDSYFSLYFLHYR